MPAPELPRRCPQSYPQNCPKAAPAQPLVRPRAPPARSPLDRRAAHGRSARAQLKLKPKLALDCVALCCFVLLLRLRLVITPISPANQWPSGWCAHTVGKMQTSRRYFLRLVATTAGSRMKRRRRCYPRIHAAGKIPCTDERIGRYGRRNDRNGMRSNWACMRF